ncbi:MULTISPECIES: mechanosensitive ion channel family protein [Cyanophyceae]|uniref:mechanosensitive ion channel family protein n=1 Tax=Cyanophyceae TaxID=3028117 RepID=UPI00168A1563|nr:MULTISPECIES: mechanosensitive ion channel family protein [Cyanophyceae]MBD1917921.1 mechanosensitive ion channel family protein [Phormidium sp. FACHB-77]MBD2029169.1 mechanosensitive ion channel family protein [Phormidium sp. FACHB-322]MBD2049701.1 mechanosensitive ion channel family protein [Leptolyngbya sp. FACHB-60]
MAWGRQNHWRRLWLLALGLGLALGLSWPVPHARLSAFAQTTVDPAAQFFADVLVRGQPVLQVGGLPDVSAADRAGQINRRIAALLNQTDNPDPITVNVDGDRDLATLQVNQRVIMTVTQQDALDFDTDMATLAQRWANLLNQAMARTNLAAAVSYRIRGTAQQLTRNTLDNLPALLGALVVLVLTWLLAALVRHTVLVWASKTEGDRTTEELISRLCYGGVWTLGSVVALGVMGLNFAALLGTLGLTSVAIGFSLRDVLSNYISGVILLATRPFRIGDQIVINNFEGTVTQIQLRATTVQTYDGRLVYIPNQEVFQSSITNNTASPVRLSSVTVGIDHDADLPDLFNRIQQQMKQIKGVELDPEPIVLVRELTPSTVNLEAQFWVNSRKQSFLQVTSHVLAAIKLTLQDAQFAETNAPEDMAIEPLSNEPLPNPPSLEQRL